MEKLVPFWLELKEMPTQPGAGNGSHHGFSLPFIDAEGALILASGSVPTTHLIDLDFSPSGFIGEPGYRGISDSNDAAVLTIEVRFSPL